MLVLDVGCLGCARVDCRRDGGVRVIHDEKGPPCGASDPVGAESLHVRISLRHPERSVLNRELHDDVVTVAYSVEHFRPESTLVERNRSTLNIIGDARAVVDDSFDRHLIAVGRNPVNAVRTQTLHRSPDS